MERLDKLLASCGNITRKQAKTLVKAGGVTVNGAVAIDSGQKLFDSDIVGVNGKPITSEKYVYYMMNKPAGILSATTDLNHETVLDLVPAEMRRKGLFPAGRLDKDTEGFVLITNDGAFAHKILSPRSHVPKTYFARLGSPVPADLVSSFAQGLDLGGKDICSPARLEIQGGGSEARLVIFEGMYHQVKRMFEKFSIEVVYLKRLAIGGLFLDEGLAPGETRKILHKEVELIAQSFVDIF